MAAFEPTVAVICPLFIEMQAVLAVFDGPVQVRCGSEEKSYYSGTISQHSTVAICLPEQNVGVVQARGCGDWLQREFPSLQHRFLVGVAGGIPHKNIDIRLGDIVIGTHICKYDSGKWVNGELQVRPALKEAPQKLQDAIPMFRALQQQTQSQLLENELMNMRRVDSVNGAHWIYPNAENVQDVLFEPGYACSSQNEDPCSCDQSRTVERGSRQFKSPRVHYGLIASGDQVMKDDKRRDKLKDDFRNIFRMDVLAVEMEAAGLADLGYMVFRGICDYADSHKNKNWQQYAAGSAAAYFKTFLTLFHTPNPRRPNSCNGMLNPRLCSVIGQISLPDRPQKSFAEGSASYGNISAESSIFRSITHNGTLESQSEGLDQAGSPFTQVSPITASSEQQDPQKIPTASLPYSPDYTIAPRNSSFSQEHSRDPSPFSIGSNTILINTTAETRSMDSDLKRRSWKWRLLEYCCELKPEYQVEPSKGERAELTLFQEDTVNEPLKTSRTIEVYDANRNADTFVSWIPLDGLQVGVQFDQVHLQYSNCNAQHWDTFNGMGQYKSTYNDRNPNISAKFVFTDLESANEFASLILHVDCVLPGHHQLEEFETLSGICRVGIVPELSNQLSASDQTQQRRANIIISIDNHHDTRMSFVYGLGSCFEYHFQTSQGVITISLGHLRKANYKTPMRTSPTWPPHWVHENRDGLPAEIDYHDAKSCAFRFSEHFNDDSTWKAFMVKVTGWQLHSWQNIQMQGRDAQMGVWVRETNLKLLCKARKGRQKWYCLDLPRNYVKQGVSCIAYRSGSKTLILKRVLCSEGEHINQSMTIQPAHEPWRNKPSNKKLKFPDAGKAQEFEAQIKELLTQSNPRFSPNFPLKWHGLMKVGE